jgi:hypothetical protein
MKFVEKADLKYPISCVYAHTHIHNGNSVMMAVLI